MFEIDIAQRNDQLQQISDQIAQQGALNTFLGIIFTLGIGSIPVLITFFVKRSEKRLEMDRDRQLAEITRMKHDLDMETRTHGNMERLIHLLAENGDVTKVERTTWTNALTTIQSMLGNQQITLDQLGTIMTQLSSSVVDVSARTQVIQQSEDQGGLLTQLLTSQQEINFTIMYLGTVIQALLQRLNVNHLDIEPEWLQPIVQALEVPENMHEDATNPLRDEWEKRTATRPIKSTNVKSENYWDRMIGFDYNAPTSEESDTDH